MAGDLSCFFLHLGPNSSTTITVTYEVPATTDAGTITNEATVASTEDSDTDDDTVVVVEDVDLEIAKSFADDEVTAGAAGTHTFSLLVENLGDADADNVTVVDAAPAGLTFISEDSPNSAIVAGDLSCFFLHLRIEQLDDDHGHLRGAGDDRHGHDHQRGDRRLHRGQRHR